MKRKNMMATGLAAGLLTAAMAMNAFAAQVTADTAQSKALENAGVKQADLAFVGTEVDYDDGQQIYEVNFLTNDFIEYEYDINAGDGTILNISYNAETNFYNNSNKTGKAVTLEQAKAIALEHAGKESGKTTFVKELTSYDDGRQIHKVEFYTDTNEKYEYEIDTATGFIFDWEYASNKSGLRSDLAKNTKISASDAKAAALTQAGLKDSQVAWGRVHADYDDGHLVYEGKFFYNSLEYEFEVDANTGNIVGWDVESMYH